MIWKADLEWWVERIWKEANASYFKVLPRPAETKENIIQDIR
jgi:hypothetical protein